MLDVDQVQVRGIGEKAQESKDVAWCPGMFWRNREDILTDMIRSIWRVVKPGGRIVWMDEVVDPSEGSEGRRRSVLELLEVMQAATGGEVALEYVHSF
jgi:ubiquinone/menaquinone biosynthesis C-methylase UbiE